MSGLLQTNSCLRFLIFGCCTIAILSQDVLRWRRLDITGSSPKPRKDAAIGFDASRNKITIFGGRGNHGTFSDTWNLDIANQKWLKANDTLDRLGVPVPGPKFGAVYGTNGASLFVTFGRNRDTISGAGKVYRYEFNSTKWSLVETMSGNPAKRFATKGVIVDNYLYASHGLGESDLLSDGQRLNLKRKRWEKIHDEINQYNPVSPHARYAHGMVALSGKQLLMFGGCLSGKESAGPCPSSDGWLFETESKKWTMVKNGPSARKFPGISMLPNSSDSTRIAIMFGGKEAGDQVIKIYGEAKENEVAVYDALKKEWMYKKTIKDPLFGFPKLRYSHAMVTTNAGILVFGGASTSDDKLLNDAWILKGDTETARRSPVLRRRSGRNFNMIMLHGIFMFLAWAIFMQFGVFVARYMRKEKKWLAVHRTLMVSGLVLSMVGFAIGIASFKGSHFSFAHGAIGLDIMLAGLYQPLNAAFRPSATKEGEKKRLWRRVWEISQKFTGIIALLLAMINISLGLFLSVAPQIIWIAWFSFLGLLTITYIIAELCLRIKGNKIVVNETGHDNDVPMN